MNLDYLSHIGIPCQSVPDADLNAAQHVANPAGTELDDVRDSCETKCTHLLQQLGIEFKKHFVDCADVLEGETWLETHTRQLGHPSKQVKTMVVEVEKVRAVIVLLLNDYGVDTNKVAKHMNIGKNKVKLCHKDKSPDYTGYQFGGTSPIGTVQQMQVFAQMEVQGLDEIFVSGGLPDLAVSLSRSDLEKAVGGIEYCDVAKWATRDGAEDICHGTSQLMGDAVPLCEGNSSLLDEPAAEPKLDEGSEEEALCKLDFRCGRILSCEAAPDADSLYVLKVNVGDPEPRQVMSSLVEHYKQEELVNRQVVVYCNIKPGKMRGLESQAMILAAVKNNHAPDEVVELLTPPEGTQEGTRATCNGLVVGSLSEKQSVKNISKVWKKVQPLLITDAQCQATFKGARLMMGGAPITVTSLTSMSIS